MKRTHSLLNLRLWICCVVVSVVTLPQLKAQERNFIAFNPIPLEQLSKADSGFLELSDYLFKYGKQQDIHILFNTGLTEHKKLTPAQLEGINNGYLTIADVLKTFDLQLDQVSDKAYVLSASVSEKATPETIAANVATRKLKGKVIDDQGYPVPNASVVIVGTAQGTATGLDGSFELNYNGQGDSLRVSYIGYLPQTLAIINGKDYYDIQLIMDQVALDQVVVTGYATQKARDLTTAVSTVETNNIEARPLNNALQAMQGTVSGVTVINDGGDPTSSPVVRVRGIGTLSNEAPLYVVDGVPGGSVPAPNDIKSITVLKDASSAAIYGVRAAAGVILIETKKGSTGKPVVEFNMFHGFSNVAKKIEALNAQEYADVMNTAFDNDGVAADAAARDYIKADTNPDGLVTRTDWVDEIFRTANSSNYDLSIRGGQDKFKYYSSLAYRENEGVLLNTYHKRTNFRFNANYDPNDRLSIAENFNVQYSNGNYGANTSSGYTGAIISAIYYPASATIWEDKANGLYGGVAPRGSQYIGSYGDLINPVAYLERLNDKRPSLNLSGNVTAAYKILDNLKYKLNLGVILDKSESKSFTSKITEPGKIFDYNELYQSSSQSYNWVIEHTLNYDTYIADRHSLSAVVGYTAQKFESQWFSTSARGFASENKQHQYFPNASGPFNPASGGKTGNAIVSYLGRVDYRFMDKYLFNVIVRRDGSSKLIGDNRWGTFPAVSGAWRISEESFMQSLKSVSDLKLRLGWGKMGNLGSLSDFPSAVPLSRTRALLGGPADYDGYYGYAENELSNPDINWEITSQTNGGIDLSMFEDKLFMSLDVFEKKTEDMLIRIPVTGTAGVGQGPWGNLGSVKNTGWEFSLGYKNNVKDFSYSINTNFSSIKNEVTDLGGYVDYIQHGENVRGVLRPLRSQVGQPLFSYYVIESDGLFKSQEEVNAHTDAQGNLLQPNAQPGDLKFIDRNDDGVINDDDRYFAGSAFPKLNYGINADFAYKNWELNILIQGASGFKVFNGMKLSTLKPTQGYNMLDDVLDAWTPSNTGSDIPRLSIQDPNNNFGTTSDWYLEDASYLRVKSLTVGYSLPLDLIAKAGVSKARIYMTANNLMTITGYSGFDPEVIVSHGIDMGRYPQPRTFVFGLNLNF